MIYSKLDSHLGWWTDQRQGNSFQFAELGDLLGLLLGEVLSDEVGLIVVGDTLGEVLGPILGLALGELLRLGLLLKCLRKTKFGERRCKSGRRFLVQRLPQLC
jgi:hypothetical protein